MAKPQPIEVLTKVLKTAYPELPRSLRQKDVLLLESLFQVCTDARTRHLELLEKVADICSATDGKQEAHLALLLGIDKDCEGSAEECEPTDEESPSSEKRGGKASRKKTSRDNAARGNDNQEEPGLAAMPEEPAFKIVQRTLEILKDEDPRHTAVLRAILAGSSSDTVSSLSGDKANSTCCDPADSQNLAQLVEAARSAASWAGHAAATAAAIRRR